MNLLRTAETIVAFGKSKAGNHYNRVLMSAVLSLVCNFLYALYHGVMGVINLSLWFFVMCAFYGILAVMRLCAVLSGRKKQRDRSDVSQRYVMKISGILLLLLGIVLTAIINISLSQHIATVYDTITMITIATYTFGKITVTIVNAVRQRRNSSPLLLVIRNIRYAEVAASVLTLQRSMLVSFGEADEWQIYLMNALTGLAVCMFVVVLGILLMIKSGKEMNYGQIKTCENE